MPRLLLIFVLGAAVLVGLLFYQQMQTEPLKVSGFVEAHEIRVGSRVGGRVKRVAVEEGDKIKQDELLIEFEPYDLLARQAEASALVATHKFELQRLAAGYQSEEVAQFKAKQEQLLAHQAKLVAGPRKQEIAAAQARLELAHARLTAARSHQGRTETLFGQNVATREQLDEANEQLRVTQSEVQVRIEELELLKEGTQRRTGPGGRTS